MVGRRGCMGPGPAYHVFCVGADRRIAEVACRVIDPYVLKRWGVYISAAPLIDAPDSVNPNIYLWLYPFYITKNNNKSKRWSVYTVPRLLLPLVSCRRSMRPRLLVSRRRSTQPRLSSIHRRASRRPSNRRSSSPRCTAERARRRVERQRRRWRPTINIITYLL